MSFRGILKISPNDYYDEINPENIKNANFNTSFLSCTDSDGYFVGFRLSSKAVEFDNLGIIGETTATDSIRVFKNEKDTLFINGITLPENGDSVHSEGRVLIHNEEQKWHYENLSDIIKKHVKERLKMVQSIPTGSIIWV